MKQWYRAEIRWAEMEAGEQGLRAWEESVYFFQSEDRDAAFQQALNIGRRDRDLQGHDEGSAWVETRLAQVVTLDSMGANPAEFEVPLGRRPANERLPFEHSFNPERTAPLEIL
jgi:hypothetical protein